MEECENDMKRCKEALKKVANDKESLERKESELKELKVKIQVK